MENAKLSSYQFFVMILLFEMGTSLVISLGSDAKQNTWFSILLGSLIGILFYHVNYKIYTYYPNELPSSYSKKIVGNFLGSILGYFYIIYFTYICARVTRDFGELLVAVAYTQTPLFIVNAIMIILCVFAVKKGIEVIARTAEINFALMYLFAITGLILILVSGLIELENLKPVLRNNWRTILRVVILETAFVPFGEMIAFTYLFPYLNYSKNGRFLGSFAILLSGINLSITAAINVAVLSVPLFENTQFPLLSTIQYISIGNFIERLDIFFIFAAFIGAFFKIAIYFYVAVIATTDLFHLKDHKKIVYPFGLIVLFLSQTIASNYQEHINEGLKFVPPHIHIPFQIGIPVILLVIAFLKNRKKEKNMSKTMKEG